MALARGRRGEGGEPVKQDAPPKNLGDLYRRPSFRKGQMTDEEIFGDEPKKDEEKK